MVRRPSAGRSHRRRRRLPQARRRISARRLAETERRRSGRSAPLDVRTLCITRETLARHDGLADFAFAMQGLGTGAISLFGSDEQQSLADKTRAGKAISAFALSEPRSGSDVANMEMTATRDGDDYVLSGEKTWISNGGIADLYCVFARTGEAPGAKGISCFLVPADTPGLTSPSGWR
jgi:acyl-CoA dehydrogenase